MIGALILLSSVAAADTSIEEFFTAFKEKRDAIQFLEASFVQETISPEEHRRIQGMLAYVKPRRILYRYYGDPEVAYVVDDDRYYEYLSDLKQVEIFNVKDRPETEVLLLGFDNDTQRLRKDYDIAFIDAADPKQGKTAIELRPKADAEDAPAFEWIRINLRDVDLLPYRIEVKNDPETRMVFQVSRLITNDPASADKARFLAPEGTTIIDANESVETVGPGGKYLPPPMKLPAPPSAPETLLEPATP